MSGAKQREDWYRRWRAEGRPDTWQQQFVYLPRSAKVTCLVCGASGYPGWVAPNPWQLGCLIGHRTCPDCSAPVHSLGSHRTCKLRHTCCTDHPHSQYRRMKEGTA